MRTRNFSALSLLLLLLSSLLAVAQAKLEKVGLPSDASVPAAVRSALDPSGARLVRADGSVLCEIWLRQAPLPAGKVAAAKGATYPELSPGMFVGLISFPNGGKDFRGQPVKGYFTMRYALLPEDGNHLGVAPTRDFVLLSRASDDGDPGGPFDYARLVKLSAQAAGTNHPAAFLLLAPDNNPTLSPQDNNPTLSPPKAGGDKGGATKDNGGTTGGDKGGPTITEPRTYQNADSYQVFAGTVRTDGGKSVPIALVVKGQAEQ
ncbi:MAG: hypothetical protein LAO06_06845 [Acidobacteriia bacterium]|nr:hypothetical protein [Terriglobia bacterium]